MTLLAVKVWITGLVLFGVLPLLNSNNNRWWRETTAVFWLWLIGGLLYGLWQL